MSWQLKPKKKVGVRLYCHGLGDCILINLSKKNAPYFMMIDLGVYHSNNRKKERFTEIMNSILVDTGGVIDQLVITHEHADHVNGFLDTEDIWKQINVKNVWMSWTEDGSLQEVKDFDTVKSFAMSMIDQGLSRLAGTKLHDFTADQLAFLGATGNGVRRNRDFAANLAKKPPEYLKPGMTRTLGGTGASVAVLGPPLGIQKLKSGHVESDQFEHMRMTNAAMTLGFASPTDSESNRLRAAEDAIPFTPAFRISASDDESRLVEANAFDMYKRLNDAEFNWRKIDHDWLVGMGQLAMQVNSYTNNTSLVLALQLSDKRVLLFPGDAETGVIQTWFDQTYKMPQGNLTAEELLGQTVLYKVGHHSSRNASSRKVLDLFKAKQLISMDPTEPDKYEGIPWEPLMAALREKGPFVRTDKPEEAPKPFVVSPQISTVTGKALWVQVEI